MTTLSPAHSPASLALWQRPAHWWRTFGRPPRLMGLDVARGLAILGMVGAHIGVGGDAQAWSGLVNGHPSILFAVLAGFSIALMTGRMNLPTPEDLPRLRLSFIGRGAVIFAIGLLLELLHTPVAVILTMYGLLYMIAIPFLRWRSRDLLILAAALAVFSPPLLAGLQAVTMVPTGPGLMLTLYGMYPITAWTALMLAGMAVGRMSLTRMRTVIIMLLTGLALEIAGSSLRGLPIATTSSDVWLATPASATNSWEDYGPRLMSLDPGGLMVDAVLAGEAHSGGTVEIVSSGGFAFFVLGLCLLLSRPLRWILLPVAALGSIPMTAYTAHLVSIMAIASPGASPYDPALWGWTTVALLIGATAWSMFLGRGPLERLTARAARAMAGRSH